jgi:LacI family transcriptional regulator
MGTVPTIRDVARSAGVAIGTVSRVLNGHKSVGDEVRRRVLTAVTSLGYEPDVVAQSMRLGVTRTIACATRDIAIPGLGSNINAAEEVLGRHGYILMVATTEGRTKRDLELLRVFAQRRVDAVFIATSSEDDPELNARLEQMKVPVVLMDRDAPDSLDAVLTDHRRGTREAAEDLIGLGHSRIALLTGPASTRPARERVRGFEEAIASLGRRRRECTVRLGSFSAEFGCREALALLSPEPRPTAIIAGGMEMLAGVLRAIRALALRIPDDVSLIAGADTDLASLATPAITIVRWSEADVGRVAAELLLERLQGRRIGPARRIVLPTELVIRESCGAPR